MKDPVPNLKAAGHAIIGVREKENADFSVRQDLHMTVPNTPDGLKKFRKTHVMQPGQIQKHWGLADDQPKFPPTYSYGKSTYGSEHVSDLIKA